MSMFPSVGSTVTRVATNKSGTVAKVEFDDGTSLVVKYEALVIDDSAQEESVVPVRKESRVLVRRNITPQTPRIKPIVQKTAQPHVMSESEYKTLAAKVLDRQESRQEKIFKQWEKDTGQFDHEAGPLK